MDTQEDPTTIPLSVWDDPGGDTNEWGGIDRTHPSQAPPKDPPIEAPSQVAPGHQTLLTNISSWSDPNWQPPSGYTTGWGTADRNTQIQDPSQVSSIETPSQGAPGFQTPSAIPAPNTTYTPEVYITHPPATPPSQATNLRAPPVEASPTSRLSGPDTTAPQRDPPNTTETLQQRNQPETQTPLATTSTTTVITPSQELHATTPPQQPSPPKNRSVSFADALMQGASGNTSPLLEYICEIEDEPVKGRVPPSTDLLCSVWLDMEKTSASHDEVKLMAMKNPNIKGVGFRKEAQWLECYCRNQESVDNLLKEQYEFNGRVYTFLKARSAEGDQLVIKLSNVNPTMDEEVTRKALITIISGAVSHVEKVAPVYLTANEGTPQQERLLTRRWNALVYVPVGHKLVVTPLFRLHGVTVLVTWKGSTC